MSTSGIKVKRHQRQVPIPRFTLSDPIGSGMDVLLEESYKVPGKAYRSANQALDAFIEHERLVSLFSRPAGELSPLELEEVAALRAGRHPDSKTVMVDVRARARVAQTARVLRSDIGKRTEALGKEAQARLNAYLKRGG